MHNIKFIRENSELFDNEMKKRKIEGISKIILDLDNKLRSFKTKSQVLQNKRNLVSKKIGQLIRESKNVSTLQEEVKNYKNSLINLEVSIKKTNLELDKILINLPNLLDNEVPIGFSEKDNKLIKTWGKKPSFEFSPKDHVTIGEKFNQMDFKVGAKLSGTRFVLLKNEMALLERALTSFMIDINVLEFGHLEVSPPYLVNSEALIGTGQLPKFADDLFKTESDKWLIPTAEVPLTNIVRNEILDEDKLPIKLVSHTPCFRSEAGAAGKDTRGMIRQHQFSKVEMVSIVKPDESNQELLRLTKCAEKILQKLKLPYRVVILCSEDTGFSSSKTFDIEVWLPGQQNGKGEFREISSCSNCKDFQSRRMNARFRDKETKQLSFVHTLNGSCLAVGRTMIAIIENYQQSDGSVIVPDVLQKYMYGKKVIFLDQNENF